MKMAFKTHQEIDDYFVRTGRLTKEDINELYREEIAVGLALQKSQRDAKNFLKRKMGIIKYYLWKIFAGFPLGIELSYGFGYDGYIEKSKELGWENTFKYPTNF